MECFALQKRFLDMAFAVVKFIMTNEVEVVPMNWLRDSNRCFWPPKKFCPNIKRVIEKGITASEAWESHGIENLGIFGTYEEARRKLKRAEDTSDLNTDKEQQHGRGKREKRRKRYSSSSSSSSTSVECNSDLSLPTPPPMHSSPAAMPAQKDSGLGKTESQLFSQFLESSGASDTQTRIAGSFETVKKIKSIERPLSFNVGSRKDISYNQDKMPGCSQSVTASKSGGEEEYSQSLINTSYNNQSVSIASAPKEQIPVLKSAKLSVFEQWMVKEVLQMKASQKLMLSSMDQLIEGLNTQNRGQESHCEEMANILNRMPLASSDDISEVEIVLQNKEVNDQFILYLSKIGGPTLDVGVKLMLRKILNDGLAKNYSYLGAKGKHSFKALRLCRAILGSTWHFLFSESKTCCSLNLKTQQPVVL